jgi:hypothetical protein
MNSPFCVNVSGMFDCVYLIFNINESLIVTPSPPATTTTITAISSSW